MAVGEFTHTSFEEQEEFEELPINKKLLKIFLNGRETNGHVAEAFERIGELRRDVDSLKSDAREVKRATQDNLAVSKFIRKWGAWGTAAILFAVTLGDRVSLWDNLWRLLSGN